MSSVTKIGSVNLALCVLLIGAGVGCARLPSDERAEAFFRVHRQELDALVVLVSRDPKLDFVSADFVGYGSDATDPAHLACAKVLKQIGAKFLRRGEGAIEIYLWGTGCAMGHDSYKGYAFITPEARLLKCATVVKSLQEKALPKGKYAPIEDDSYIRLLDKGWYMIRWECG